MSEGTREVRVTTKTSDSLPKFIRGTKGLYKVTRISPAPAGYLEQVDADKMDEEYLKRRWGGGLFECTWFPPPEATDKEPVTFEVEVFGPPKGLETPTAAAPRGNNTDPAVLALLQNLNKRLDQVDSERNRAMDGEWMKLLDVQRGQTSSMLGEVVGLMGTFHQHQLAMLQEASKDRDARHEQSLERERAFFQQTLQMQQQQYERNQPIPKGLEQLDDLVKLVEVAGQLGGGNKGDESLAQTVVKALPGVMDGLASGYERAASAASELRARRQAARAGGGEAFGLDMQPQLQPPPATMAPPAPAPHVPGPAGPLTDPPEPTVHFGPPPAQPPQPAQPSPQTSDEAPAEGETELPEGADPQWMDSDEGHEFLAWLDYMESKSPDQWRNIIVANYQAGGLPGALVAPLESALAGDGEPLLQLFTKAGALDLLQVALQAFGYDATGTGQPMEPTGSAPAPVDVAQGDVDEATGLQPHSEPESHHQPLPDPSGDAGDGDPDSEVLPDP